MSAPKVGDRVRVTYEGTYAARIVPLDAGIVSVRPDGLGFEVSAPTSSVEVLPPPLPTTPGSVVRHTPTCELYLLHGNDQWYGRNGAGLLIGRHIEVIHDAGAQS